MRIQVGMAIFDDAEEKFFIFDSIADEAFFPLYREEQDVQGACRNGAYKCAMPLTVNSDKSESVTLFFYIDESGKGTCTRSFTDPSRTYITGYRSIEHYQIGRRA